MDTPVSDFLNEYASSGTARFHMPGHKGRIENGLCDITEIQGADSLYEASGIIARSEANASGLFGTAATLYSAEGSSQCVRAMLALACGWENSGRGRVILAARNVHRSFLTAAALLDLEVEWLYPEDEEFSLCGCRVSPEQVRRKIAGCTEKPAAVYLTSPDYLGRMQDIRAISDAAHEAGIPLLVDNAHGAYLHFLDDPLHPMDLGADMCCDSAHKTLPSLTGCAYLHISRAAADKDIYIGNAKKALAMFGSTSPSYLLLKSLDETNAALAGNFRTALRSCCSAASQCREQLIRQGWTVYKDTEPLKITIDSGASGLNGRELADSLRQHGIECEYADSDTIVLMPSPYNDEKDFEALVSGMQEASGLIRHGGKAAVPMLRPEKVLSIREAMFAPAEIVPADESIGRVMADAALACPPAVPVFICGERIPEGAEEIFARCGITHVAVVREI